MGSRDSNTSEQKWSAIKILLIIALPVLIGFLEFLLIAILIYTSFLLQLLIKFLQQYHVPQQFELLLENKAVLIVCILIFLLILSYVLLYLMLRGLLYSIYANARYIGVVTIGLSLSLLNGVWLGYALLHSSELTAFLLIAIVSISFLIFAIYLLYRYYVLPVIILSVGVYAFAAGFTLITYSISYAAAASPLISAGLILISNGSLEYFKWAVVNIEVVEDKPIFNTYPDFCGTGREFITNSIGYLRLHAKNSGPGIARNCVAQVRVLRRLSIDGSGECRGGGPSPEYNYWVDLTWAGNVIKVDINPSDVRVFNLVVMPLDGNNRPFFAGNSSMAMACGGSPPYAWFARPDVMNVVFVMRDNRPVMLNGCLNRPQDCLTRCVYEIEVRVTCENGRAEPVRLRLTIGDEWGSTRIEEV